MSGYNQCGRCGEDHDCDGAQRERDDAMAGARRTHVQTTTVRVNRRDAPDDVAEKFLAAINASGCAIVSITEEGEDHGDYTIAWAMAQDERAGR